MGTSQTRSHSAPPLTGDRLRRALETVEPAYPGPRLAPRELVEGEFLPRPNLPPPGVEPRVAAVLAIFYPYRGKVRLLLTRRPEYPGHHGGQISLPGGSIEPQDDSPLDAALRETREEVGVTPSRLEVWGSLEPIYIPVSNFRVLPFMAWSPNRPRFRPDPFEVAEIVELPLSVLLDPAALAEEEWTIRGEQRLVPYIRFGPHRIWGATAMILDQVRWKLEHFWP